MFAIAPSPREKGLVWAGTNDGQLWLTRDGTATWTNVTKNIPGLPADGTVTSIAPSTFDAGTAYVAIDYAGMEVLDIRDPQNIQRLAWWNPWIIYLIDAASSAVLIALWNTAISPRPW